MHRPLRKLPAFSAIALVLLSIAACGQSAGKGPNARATQTPANGLPLAWHAVTMPTQGAFAIAPGDGDIGYACQVESARRIAVSATHDRAATWTHVGVIALADANQCFMTVDGLQPTTVMVAVTWEPQGASPITAFFTNYVTFDGGATWRKLSAPKPYLAFQFSTLQGVIYGYLRVANGEQDIPELATSSDQMRTWHPILQGIADVGGVGSTAFWLNPANGSLLVKDASVFWSSADAGAHWAKVLVPGLAASGAQTVVQAPVASQASQPWHLCAANDDALNLKDMQPNTLTCSSDGGATWRQGPGLNVMFTSAKGNFVTPTSIFALADDGAILATSSSPNDPATEREYRLAQGGRTWQAFASPPGRQSTISYYPAPGGGVLWDGTYEGQFTASYP